MQEEEEGRGRRSGEGKGRKRGKMEEGTKVQLWFDNKDTGVGCGRPATPLLNHGNEKRDQHTRQVDRLQGLRGTWRD